MAYTDRSSTCLLTCIVILLCKTEVYQYNIVFIVKEYIGRLDIKMHHALLMDKAQG